MKKRFFALLTLLLFILTACADTTTQFSQVNTVEGVTLEVKEGTLTRSAATFLLSNHSDTDLSYDPIEFHMEQWKKDHWAEFSGTRDSAWKRDKSESLPAGSEKELEIKWKTLIGTLQEGDYRLILIVDGQPVAVEFTRE